MSDDILARARAALDGVTPGPWVHDPKLFSNVYSDDATGSIVATCTGFTYARRPPADEAANARFIAFARSLVPEMADEITRLRAEVERLREAWEPPPAGERPDGYECLGQNSYNIWRHVQWSKRNGWTVRGTFDHITPTAFAPLPEAHHD
jgi:HAMP domain-containing protein